MNYALLSVAIMGILIVLFVLALFGIYSQVSCDVAVQVSENGIALSDPCGTLR